MRLVRTLAAVVALGVIAAALAACAAGSAPQWTFSPTPTPTVAPSVAATQAPAASGAASAAPGASQAPAASPAASSGGGGGGAAVVLKIAASGVAYDTASLEAPANTPFQIVFTNNDAGIPHNVSIHKDSPTGAEIFKGEIFSGVDSRTYDVPALPAGTYGFACTVHPNMTGTLTVK